MGPKAAEKSASDSMYCISYVIYHILYIWLYMAYYMLLRVNIHSILYLMSTFGCFRKAEGPKIDPKILGSFLSGSQKEVSYGCFHKLKILCVGFLIIRDLVFGLHDRAADLRKSHFALPALATPSRFQKSLSTSTVA